MKKLLIIALFLIVPTFIYANEEPVWVEAAGEAILGELDTPKEVKERAKRDAERNAIEKAVGTFIRSHSLVSNSQIVEDLIYAGVRGKIDKIDLIKEGWDERDRNTYQVFLRALVRPVYQEKLLSLKLTLSKTELQEGDEVQILYQANRDCYVYIFSVAADGSVTLLFPNTLNKDNAVRGSEIGEFPPKGSKIKLQARFLPGYTEPVAQERIKIIATRHKEDIIPLGFQEGLFKVFNAQSTGMISDLVKRLNQLEPSDWAESTAVYTLRR